MKYLSYLLNSLIVYLIGNLYFCDGINTITFCMLLVVYVLINIQPLRSLKFILNKRFRIEQSGVDLLIIFLVSLVFAVITQIYYLIQMINTNLGMWLVGLLLMVIVEGIVWLNGIIRVYCTSTQLGIKERVIGVLCGWIPLVNIWALCRIILICNEEVSFENDKELLDIARKDEKVCQTKYPILLVHGVFFRDFRYLNYWGRIPKELESNGATIYYGDHQSAASVEESGKELARRVNEICEKSGCEKVNVIAHSKGGLDIRYAVAYCGIEDKIASISTINTPHRGCIFAEYLLSKMPEDVKNGLAFGYNGAMKKLGDENPDFLAACYDLTATKCIERDEAMPKISDSIYCQSVGSKLNKATGGKFPLNYTYHIVRTFDGPNDGLVAANSFEWGSDYQYLTVKGNRGISHGDMIDLNRENIKEFDVREFYVTLVNKLKNKGL